MKILFVLRPSRGGMKAFVERAVPLLQERGVEVAIAGPDRMGMTNVREWFLATGGSLLETVRLSRRVREVASEWGADLIHAHGLRAALPLLFEGHWPYVYTLHGFPPSGAKGALFRGLEKRIVARAQGVNAVSSPLARYGEGIGARTCPVLPPAVSVPREAAPFPEGGGLRLGTLARLSREKGIDLLLDAFAEVLKMRPDGRLVIGGEGPDRPALEGKARTLGLGSSVEFQGWIADTDAFFRSISLYVQPSRREGLGLAAAEAVAHGRAVVVSEAGGLPEAVGTGPWATLVRADNFPSLTEGLLAMAGADLVDLGQKAHFWAASHWGHGGLADALLETYDIALRGSPGL